MRITSTIRGSGYGTGRVSPRSPCRPAAMGAGRSRWRTSRLPPLPPRSFRKPPPSAAHPASKSAEGCCRCRCRCPPSPPPSPSAPPSQTQAADPAAAQPHAAPHEHLAPPPNSGGHPRKTLRPRRQPGFLHEHPGRTRSRQATEAAARHRHPHQPPSPIRHPKMRVRSRPRRAADRTRRRSARLIRGLLLLARSRAVEGRAMPLDPAHLPSRAGGASSRHAVEGCAMPLH